MSVHASARWEHFTGHSKHSTSTKSSLWNKPSQTKKKNLQRKLTSSTKQQPAIFVKTMTKWIEKHSVWGHISWRVWLTHHKDRLPHLDFTWMKLFGSCSTRTLKAGGPACLINCRKTPPRTWDISLSGSARWRRLHRLREGRSPPVELGRWLLATERK